LDDICPNEVVELPSPYKQRDFVAENQHFANEWPYGEDFSLTASAPASGTSTDNVINNILAFAPYLHNWINEPNFELPSWCNGKYTPNQKNLKIVAKKNLLARLDLYLLKSLRSQDTLYV
jgi:hypothetical protein